MKKILIYFLILQIINITIQVLPLWNFESYAFNLFANGNSHNYTIIEKKLYAVTLRLEREILKENGNIIVSNRLYLNDQDFGITEYDDVESFYQNNNKNFLICPKGKFHMYIYNINSGQYRTVIPDGFEEKGDWNYMCFYQFRHDTMFVGYLGDEYSFYQFDFQGETFKASTKFNHALFAFKWKTEGYYYYTDSQIQFFAITRNWGAYYVNNYIVYVGFDENINYYELNYRRLYNGIKDQFIASFGKDDNFYFYYINYNNSNVSDFAMGGYTGNEKITTDNFGDIKIEEFTKSPLVFFEKMEIVDLKFIFAMSFAYYILKDDNGKFYYGIIEVPSNRVIFHTDEEIIKYIPYSDNAMLAITEKSAYKICVSRDENDCKICDNNEFMLDSSKYNFCGTSCNSKYTIIPHNICSDTCDERIFSIKDNKCGLCKDFEDGNEYKFYNRPGCINRKPENTIYVNEDLKIIDCDNNYKYENGNCILKCHDNCDKCSMYSTDDNNQHCISCKNGELFLQEGNCVEKCSNKYFLNDKNCEKCDESCETCDKASNNCTSCKNGKYMDKNTETHMCKDCINNCETCEFSEDNCITCNQTSSFKYFFNSSCYEKCPKNTKLNEKNSYICEEDKNNSNSDSVMLSIFTIITAGLLFLTLFCFFRRYCCLNKKAPDNLLNEINTELREN